MSLRYVLAQCQPGPNYRSANTLVLQRGPCHRVHRRSAVRVCASSDQAILKVFGVGGCGCNAVNNMVNSDVQGVELWIANTDAQSLTTSPVDDTHKLQLGAILTRGLGAGKKPDVGEKAALESRDAIAAALQNTDMVFVTAGMGGGTGSGAAPIVAKIAKDMGILTVGVVTTPFTFEGRIKAMTARTALAKMRAEVDTLVVIPNQRVLDMYSELPAQEAWKKADDVLRQAVKGISEIITVPGLVNVDFADVRSIMTNAGSSLMGQGYGTGPSRAHDAAVHAISSPLLEVGIEKATAVVWNITGPPNLTLHEVNEAAEIIYDMVDPGANIIFGSVIDNTLPEDTVSITIIATGFGNLEPELGALQQDEQRLRPLRSAAPVAGPAAAPQVDGRPAQSRNSVAGGLETRGVEIPAFLRRRRL